MALAVEDLGARLQEGLRDSKSSIEGASVDVQAEHCIKWIRDHCLIQDPISSKPIPFDLYDYQEAFIHLWLAEIAKARAGGHSGIRTEKSRQMGDSWLFMAIELYTLRFWNNFRALNISRKQNKVDDGGQGSTPDSLHGKIRFMHEHLVHDTFRLNIRHRAVVNPITGAAVLGEAATPNAARAGTYLYGLWDETAFTDHSWAIFASWDQAVRCPHYLSTPQGKVNVFAHLRNAPLEQVRHHWPQHPIKSEGLYRCEGGIVHAGHREPCQGGELRSPWYDKECERLTPEIIAQELDISYERSISGRAFPEFDAEVHGVRGLPVESGGTFVMTIDPGVVTAAACLVQFVELPGKTEARVVKAWKGHDATAETYAALYEEWSQTVQQKVLVTGDPAGFNRDLTYGKSVFGEMHDRHHIQVLPFPKTDVPDRVRLIRDHMAGRTLKHGKTGAFAYELELEDFATDMEGAKWPTDSDGRVTKETDLEHNEAEHMADALSYGFAYYHSRSTAIPKTDGARHGHRPITAGLLNAKF